MKFKTTILIFFCIFPLFSFAKPNEGNFKNYTDSVSYSIGLKIGQSLGMDSIPLNFDILFNAIKDGVFKDSTQYMLSDEVQSELLDKLKDIIEAKNEAKKQAIIAKNRLAGKEFLNSYKSKPGYLSTESGIVYKIMDKGNGVRVDDTDSLDVNFKAYLISGEMFQSTDKMGGKVTFALDRVINGWQESLKLITENGKIEVILPDHLAYGEGEIDKITPGSTLRFEFEILKVYKSAKK